MCICNDVFHAIFKQISFSLLYLLILSISYSGSSIARMLHGRRLNFSSGCQIVFKTFQANNKEGLMIFLRQQVNKSCMKLLFYFRYANCPQTTEATCCLLYLFWMIRIISTSLENFNMTHFLCFHTWWNNLTASSRILKIVWSFTQMTKLHALNRYNLINFPLTLQFRNDKF